jgi:hypothetical protein
MSVTSGKSAPIMRHSPFGEKTTMPRFCLTLIGLLTVLSATSAPAQTVADSPNAHIAESGTVFFDVIPFDAGPFDAGPTQIGQNPAAFQSPPAELLPPDQTPIPAGDPKIIGPPVNLDGSTEPPAGAKLTDFLGYRYSTGALEWIPGGGDQLGMFSAEAAPYQDAGIKNGLGFGAAVHFLSGPNETDLPPRLFDLSLGYQYRNRVGPLAFDLFASVLMANDFEGSARRGVFYPGHAVGYLTVSPKLDLVFGIDYLDRADYTLLPVGGLIWTPNSNMRFEVVFPRPRALFQLNDRHRVYIGGELGGGTWTVQRVAFGNDYATYTDLRLALGLETFDKSGHCTAIEVAYLFDRRLEYTSNVGNMRLDDAVMLRLLTRY